MKRKDYVLVVVIIVIAALVSFLAFNFLFGKKTNKKIKVESVQPISSEFKLPSDKYFNKTAFNPTQIITISPEQNQNPFKGQ